MKKIVICLTFILLFSGFVQAQKTKTITGIVVQEIDENKWSAIVIEVGNKKYGVQLGFNASAGDIRDGQKMWKLRIIGNTAIGKTVQVFYTRIDTTFHYGDENAWLKALKIVEVTNPILLETNPNSEKTTTRQYGEITADLDGKGNVIGLYSNFYGIEDCRISYKKGVITGLQYDGQIVRKMSLRYDDGKLLSFDDYYYPHFSFFDHGYSSQELQTLQSLVSRGRHVTVGIAICGASGKTQVFYSIKDDPAVGTLKNLATIIGYIDVIEVTGSGCRVRFISGDKSYTGIVSFDRLSALTGRRIRSYEDALAFFEGKQIRVTLSGLAISNDGISTGSFGGISRMTVLPQTTTAKTQQRWNERTTAAETIIDLSTDILFDFNKSTINPGAVPSLIRLARLLRQSTSNTVQLNGFTDSIGTDEYNIGLSQRRSAAVKQWLVTKGGIDAERLATNGYGKAQPVAPNTNPDGSDNPTGRQKNRRVEIRIPRS